MDATNTIGQFGREAAAEVDFYLDRRLSSMQWRSYGDERAWQRAAREYEAQLATFRAEDDLPVSVVAINGRTRTFRPLRRVASMAALLTLGLACMMAGSAQADVQSVEAQAKTLPAAANPQAAEANQEQLAPAVKAAIGAGHGRELNESTTSPDVRSDLLRFGGVRLADTHSPPSRYAPPAALARVKHRAHAAGCYGNPWSQTNWTVFGGTIGWLYVRENGWCGQSGYITWYGGATFAAWAWGPYCFASKGADYSWDGYPSWIHMAHWGYLGVSYPWGCLGASGGKVQIRIAWNGYWDEYNDYGF
jgi:hypothetical protein